MKPLACPSCWAPCRLIHPEITRCASCGWSGPTVLAEERNVLMTPSIPISGVRFTPVRPGRDGGLLGYVSCVLAGRLRLDGLTLRERLDGSLCVSFPERTDAAGRRHPLIQPLGEEARREIEQLILDAISHEGSR